MIDNIYNISPQQINYILELNIEKSFVKASEKCFVTQPTLSMQIKKAEDLLGLPIFDRSRNPIELTPFGEHLIPILMDIRQEYLRIEILKKKLEGKYNERVVVGVIPTISHYLIFDIFQQIQNELGHIQISFKELKSEELIEELKDGKIDLGIMAGPYNEPRLRTIPLFQEEIFIYSDFKESKVNSSQLVNLQPWLLSKGNCLRTQMVHFCSLEEDYEASQWNYEGGSIELLMKMVDLNGGYTLVPEYYQINSPKIKELIDDSTKEFPAREVIALMPSRSLKKEPCESLIRIIQLEYNKRAKKSLKVLNWR